jgi:hypothetical protein
MKKIKALSPIPAAIALVIGTVGFSGCTSLESPADIGSAMRSTSAQQVSYEQPVLQPSSNQVKLEKGRTNKETSLGRNRDPGWGPVNMPW